MTPLHNPESEEIVLGRVLLDPSALDGACSEVTAADFSVPGLAAAWQIVTELGAETSVPLVRARLDAVAQEALDRALQVASLVGTDPHVREVRACALRRRQLAELGDIVEDVKAGRGTGRVARLTELDDGQQASSRIVDGWDHTYGKGPPPPAVWGEGHEVLWQQGEPFYIVGSTGVGKTTLTHQLVSARLGLRSEVLGMPVEMHEKRVLYLACDRPAQASRALRRLIPPEDMESLRGELLVWEGPLDFDAADTPEALYSLCRQVDADTVVIDSVKDIVRDYVDPVQAQAINRAFQTCVSRGVEVLAMHHNRKPTPGMKLSINDVGGGKGLMDGAGSVVMLVGDPGDLIVDFLHVKQPDETVGPWKVEHDHRHGLSKVTRTTTDLVKVLRSTPAGMTAVSLAEMDDPKPTPNAVAKVAHRAERAVERGALVRLERDGQVRYAVAAPTP